MKEPDEGHPAQCRDNLHSIPAALGWPSHKAVRLADKKQPASRRSETKQNACGLKQDENTQEVKTLQEGKWDCCVPLKRNTDQGKRKRALHRRESYILRGSRRPQIETDSAGQ